MVRLILAAVFIVSSAFNHCTALNGLLCADVPLRTYTLSRTLTGACSALHRSILSVSLLLQTLSRLLVNNADFTFGLILAAIESTEQVVMTSLSWNKSCKISYSHGLILCLLSVILRVFFAANVCKEYIHYMLLAFTPFILKNILCGMYYYMVRWCQWFAAADLLWPIFSHHSKKCRSSYVNKGAGYCLR